MSILTDSDSVKNLKVTKKMTDFQSRNYWSLQLK